MKRYLLLSLVLVVSLFAVAAGDDFKQAYINKYSSIAVSEMKRSGVPASITLAQGMLESNYGRSALTVKGNNHFGIKCHRDWKGKKMYHDDDAKGECFRVYPNDEASFRDHSDFLRYQSRYKSLFDLDITDYKGWAKGLKAAGYATDPAYAQKLIKVIEENHLYRFDRDVRVSVEKPREIEQPRKVANAAQKYHESVEIALSRPLYEQNGVPFVYAMAGETYQSIAANYGLFADELLHYNDLRRSEPLKEGDLVYIKAKKKKAAKGVDKYIVGPDEQITVRDICQRYGVKLQSVLKLNDMKSDTALQEGDTIKLRRK